MVGGDDDDDDERTANFIACELKLLLKKYTQHTLFRFFYQTKKADVKLVVE